MYFGLQRYYFLRKYAIFSQKICFFSQKICTIQKKIVPLQPIFAQEVENGAIVYRLGQEIFIL